jgi:hypothetical protein
MYTVHDQHDGATLLDVPVCPYANNSLYIPVPLCPYLSCVSVYIYIQCARPSFFYRRDALTGVILWRDPTPQIGLMWN